MLYDIALTLEYSYDQASDRSRNLLRVVPRNLNDEQTVQSSRLTVTPEPDHRVRRTDFFETPVTEVAYRHPIDTFRVDLSARVVRTARPPALDLSPDLQRLREELSEDQSLFPGSPHHFLGGSPRVPISATMTAFAQDAVAPNTTAIQAVADIGAALFREMRFDQDATEVDTPALEAFQNRHGVCQDFTHIMIGCLRGIGIPAGYVSGFLRTLPPEGQQRLEGADAMHAWVSAWCGVESGWVEFDPTNNQLVGSDHIVIGYGRDYSDIAPIKGAIRTSGAQSSEHRVDVVPLLA